MLLTKQQRLDLRDRLVNIRECGGVKEVARRAKVSRTKIYEAWATEKPIKPLTHDLINSALKTLEKRQTKPVPR